MPAAIFKTFLIMVVDCLTGTHRAAADTFQWLGQPGITATTNWSDAANWTSSQQTYYNQVQFTGAGTNVNADATTINTVLDSATAASQMPIWQLDFNNTGGNYVTLVNPGVTLHVDAGNGWMTVGAPGTPTDAAEIIKFTGDGGAMRLEGGNLTVQQSGAAPGNHNVTLDLSGLGSFQKTGSRILVASTGNRSHGTLYLARTNTIDLGSDITICWQGGTSNSLPCALYLGQTNRITTGGGNNNIWVGQSGGSNAILAFNPSFVNTVPAAEAYIASSANGGRGNLWVGDDNGSPNAPAYGVCNLSGGKVTVVEDSIQLGRAGNSTAASALGVLSFDNGSINANTVVAGNQTTTSAGAGVGIINVGTNSIQGANATLTVNTSLTLASVTGTLTAGSAGTLNINGGVVSADTIISGGGVATITLNGGTLTTKTAGTAANPLSALAITNSTLQVKVVMANTNVVVTSLTSGGATNKVNIVSLPPIGSYPFQVPIIRYSGAIGGAGYNFGLGTVPPLAVGYLSNNVANSSVDLVLTNGPRTLTWTGANSGNWDTTTSNWVASTAINYVDGSFVSFFDGATTASVNLTAAFQPASVTISNSSPDYTFTGSGYLSGSSGLLKTGSGKLILDNSGVNNYSGATTISAGTLQVGASDANGNLPASGTVNNNGTLAFARNDSITINNTIAGTGSVMQSGGNLLTLGGANTFSGALVASNASTLKLGSASAVGTSGGATVVASGSTLDVNGQYLTSEPIVVAGAGVGGSGAIVNSGGAVYGLTTNITLTGDATFSIASRWDLGGGSGGAMNSGGQPYDVTLLGSGYFEWKRLKLDTNFGDINLVTGNLGAVGSTTFGNPTNTLTIATGCGLTFYADDTSVTVNKRVYFYDGATIANGWWHNTISGPMVLTNSGFGGYCEFNIGSYSLTLSGALTGNGIIYKTGSETLVLSGNSPSFAGGAYILGGTMTVNGTLNNPLGISLATGRLNLNSTLSGSGGVTSSAGTTVAGSGSTSSALDISGSLIPGDNGVVGTLTTGNLTLQSGASVTSDLGAVATGTNDLVAVNGNLTANGNQLYVNLVGSTLQNGAPYTLITYTGTLSGSFAGVSTVSASPYTFVLTNVTTTSPKKIQAIVTGGQSSVLAWNNASGNGEWDVQSSANWTNRTTQVSPDSFYSFDTVVFDDSITNSVTPTTNINIASGQIVSPSGMTNNSSLDYTFSGAGQITGTGGLTKQGSGTLTLNVAGNFTGPVNISGGTVKTPVAALGSVSSITVTNNATLDFNGSYVTGSKPITVSGEGASGTGALYNSGGDIYGNVLKLTLAGNATLGGSARWDLGSGSSVSGPYKATILRSSSGGYGEWDSVAVSNNVTEIELAVGNLGIKNLTTSFANPATLLTVNTNCELTFWSGGINGSLHIRSNGRVNLWTAPAPRGLRRSAMCGKRTEQRSPSRTRIRLRSIL